MRAADFVGRVGGLAVGLGIGLGVSLVGAGVASASPPASPSSPSDKASDGGSDATVSSSAQGGVPDGESRARRATQEGSRAQAPGVRRGRSAPVNDSPLPAAAVARDTASVPLKVPTIRLSASLPSDAVVLPSESAEAPAPASTAGVQWSAPQAATVAPVASAAGAPMVAMVAPKVAAASGTVQSVLSPLSGGGPLAPAQSALSFGVLATARREFGRPKAATSAAATTSLGNVYLIGPPEPVAEGNPGTPGKATFTVYFDGRSTSNTSVLVNYTVTGSGANPAAGADFISQSGSVTIKPGDSVAQFSVDFVNDNVAEPDETFTVTLAGATGAALLPGSTTATVTIKNDDVPTVSISPAWVKPFEGSAEAPGKATFTVGLANGAKAGANGVTVNYSVVGSGPRPATAGADYVSPPGSVTIKPGDSQAQLTVALVGDSTPETTEAFTVTLSAASGAMLGDTGRTATADIVDDDVLRVAFTPENAPAYVSTEGSAAEPGKVTLTVALANGAKAGADGVKVDYTATNPDAGADLVRPSGSVTIKPGETQAQLIIGFVGDDVVEPDETFLVRLKSATGSGASVNTLASVATVTIKNDDVSPVVSISPSVVSVSEGSAAAPGKAAFTVALANGAKAGANGVTVNYTAAGSGANPATPGADYVSPSGSVTIKPGDSQAQFSIDFVGDNTAESDEAFTLTLTSATGATLGSAGVTSTATIKNDDATPLPTVSISGPKLPVSEGNSGSAGKAAFTVALANGAKAGASGVTVRYTAAGSGANPATPGADYVSPSGSVTIKAGDTQAQFSVDFIADNTAEPDEAFTVTLTSATGATLGSTGRTSTATITNDDVALPAVSISGPKLPVNEGNSGSGGKATFTVALADGAKAGGFGVVVNYSAAGSGESPATAGTDYVKPSGSVTINPGDTQAQFSVDLVGDAVVENNETFTVTLSSVKGAVLGTARTATATIRNDDLSIGIIPTSIPTGQGPIAVALNPLNTRLYVSNQTSGDVTVIDITTTKFTRTTIPNVGGSPHGIAVSPDGSRVFVASTATLEGGSPKLAVYDAAMTLQKSITLGDKEYPWGVAADATRVYVTSTKTGTVFSYDTKNNYAVTAINVGAGSSPTSVVVANNKAYVAKIDGTVAVISNNAVVKTLNISTGTGDYIAGFLPAAGGKLKVFDTSGAMTTINTSDDTFTKAPPDQLFVGAPNAAVTSDYKTIYYPVYAGDTVVKIPAGFLSLLGAAAVKA